jgi:hypothetical protein
MRPHQRAILFAALASVVVWAIPGLQYMMLPVQYLNTHLHELMHALAGQASGGDVGYIKVFANGGGVTLSRGGSMWLIAPAGYVGAAVIGAGMIWMSRTAEGARNTMRLLAIVLALAMLLWVRGDFVGVISGIAWIGALWAMSSMLSGMPLLFAAQFVGLQQCLNAVQSMYVLLHLSALTDAHSDAMIMQQNTGIPAIVWAVVWCLFSLALLTVSLRHAWSQPAGSRR